jgi:hypothetical protein
VFLSGFSEGRLLSQADSESIQTTQIRRRIVTITDDFDLFHALLFYVYTDKICFTADPESFRGEFGNCHLISDGEAMYALAHRLLFDSITSKALVYLQTTCNIHKITACVFGSFGTLHEAVGTIYYNYFMGNWSQVIKTPEFEKVFDKLKEDPAEYIRVNSKFRDMVRTREEYLSRQKK